MTSRLPTDKYSPLRNGECGAIDNQTGAVCTLPKDHAENHRGAFRHGISQWPDSRGKAICQSCGHSDEEHIRAEPIRGDYAIKICPTSVFS